MMNRPRTRAATGTRFGKDRPLDSASQCLDGFGITSPSSCNDHPATTTQVPDQLLEIVRIECESASATAASRLADTSYRGIEKTPNRSSDEGLPEGQIQMDRPRSRPARQPEAACGQ